MCPNNVPKPAFGLNQLPPSPAAWPRTIEEAVGRTLAGLNPGQRDRVRAMKRDELARDLFELGIRIRVEFGLWDGNSELAADGGQGTHPDEVSAAIIEKVWEKLQEPTECPPLQSEPIDRCSEVNS